VVLEGFHIGACFVGWNALVDFDDDIGKSVGIDIYFLMIRDLTDLAGDTLEQSYDDYDFVVHVPDICKARRQVGNESAAEQLSRLESRHFDLEF
jgi:hypothetical protein